MLGWSIRVVGLGSLVCKGRLRFSGLNRSIRVRIEPQQGVILNWKSGSALVSEQNSILLEKEWGRRKTVPSERDRRSKEQMLEVEVQASIRVMDDPLMTTFLYASTSSSIPLFSRP